MLSLKGKWVQLTAEESKVIKIRWAVEAVHGIIKKKYRLLDHKVDNKLFPQIGLLCKMVYFLKIVLENF